MAEEKLSEVSEVFLVSRKFNSELQYELGRSRTEMQVRDNDKDENVNVNGNQSMMINLVFRWQLSRGILVAEI